jgi:hypothetical protein
VKPSKAQVEAINTIRYQLAGVCLMAVHDGQDGVVDNSLVRGLVDATVDHPPDWEAIRLEMIGTIKACLECLEK